MVAGGPVANDLNSIKAVFDMRVLVDPELLTDLTSYCRIITLNDGVAERCVLLAGSVSYLLVKLVLDNFFLLPGREPARFAVVVTACKEHLGTDQKDC